MAYKPTLPQLTYTPNLHTISKNNTIHTTGGVIMNVMYCMLYLNGVYPRLDSNERLFLCDVIHEDDPLGSTVVGLGHRLEPLLAGRVPQL